MVIFKKGAKQLSTHSNVQEKGKVAEGRKRISSATKILDFFIKRSCLEQI